MYEEMYSAEDIDGGVELTMDISKRRDSDTIQIPDEFNGKPVISVKAKNLAHRSLGNVIFPDGCKGTVPCFV